MKYQSYPLPESLQPWLREAWELRGNEFATPTTLYPDGLVDVLLNVGPAYDYTYEGTTGNLSPGVHLSGVLLSPITLHFHAEMHLIGLRFSPEKFYQLYQELPQPERTQIVSLEALRAWVPGSATTLNEAVQHLESHIQGEPEHDVVFQAVRWLEKTHGMMPIQELARKVAASTSKLERSFRHQVGTTPKRYGQLLRFRGLMAYLSQHTEATPKDLVYAFGYTDGSHLHKDLRQLAQKAPTEVKTHISRFFTKHVSFEWESLLSTQQGN